MTTLRFEEGLPRGRLGYAHYKKIHRHLFQDVYAWAGKIRTVRISKAGSMFCYPEHIDESMQRIFAWLADHEGLGGLPQPRFAEQAAHLLAEINAVHPFREGNGRTQLAFLMLLAERAGHPLDMTRLDPQATLAAMIQSFGGDEEPLAELIRRLIV